MLVQTDRRRILGCVSAVLAVVVAMRSVPAYSFILSTTASDPWTTTASGPRVGNGAPATLTWGFVPDGTTTLDETGLASAPSNLVAFMNANFGGSASQTDLALQPWFGLFEQSFSRWANLSGVTYQYVPQDDGVMLPSSSGQLGVRPDIRIGGINIDGSSGTLAFTYLPAGGSDMVIDTGDATFFTGSANSFRGFRNVLMHEIGHGFGLLHVDSSSSLLMEPVINTTFDGPQLDEIRGVQYFFGDANEKSHDGQGNGSAALATPLGVISAGTTKSVGAAANLPSQLVTGTPADFVSIANFDDQDFYSFSVTQTSLLDAVLTPRGGVFDQASSGATPTTFDANARNDLSLEILGADGSAILGLANSAAAGAVESIANVRLTPGAYVARILGADDTIQLYELSLTVDALEAGDFNANGVVDGDDLAIWRAHLGAAAASQDQGDATGDGAVDGADLLVWQTQAHAAGATFALATNLIAVPEPAGVPLVLGVCTALTCGRRSKKA
jgi:hypothetical protein